MLKSPSPMKARCKQRRLSPVSVVHSTSLTSYANRKEEKTACSNEDDLPHTFIQPRSFNTITTTRNSVIKSSTAASIQGELFFYKHVPSDIAHLFPSLLRHSTTTPSDSRSTTWLEIERIEGATLSSVLIDGRLTPGLLSFLIHSLHKIHTSQGSRRTALPLNDPSEIYSNYGRKVEERYRQHAKRVYTPLGLTRKSHFDELGSRLHQFEVEKRGFPAKVVHGDPVLTNVLLGDDGGLHFIDMRGSQGENNLTLMGDALYDLGKLFQSLCGYDFIIADRIIDQNAVTRLEKLQAVFKREIQVLYPSVSYDDVILVTCSLYTSLIPLHDNATHREKFCYAARAILAHIRSGNVCDSAPLTKHLAQPSIALTIATDIVAQAK